MKEIHQFVPSFNFTLVVNGYDEIPLKSVQAFTRDNEYEPIQEGGQNDYVYLKRKPISQPFKLVVERYLDYSLGLMDPLSNGAELVLPLLLFVGKNVGYEIDAARYYTFTGCVVMGKTYGALEAERSGLLTETITIGYNHMFCTNIPASEGWSSPAYNIASDGINPKYSVKGIEPKQNSERWLDLDLNADSDDTVRDKARRWNFDDRKVKGQGPISHRILSRTKEEEKPVQRKYNFAAENNKEYKGKKDSVRSAQNSAFSDKTLGPKMGIKELSEQDMIDKARRFEMTDDGLYTGNGQLSARHNEKSLEPHLKEMTEAAKGWRISKDGTKDGNGVRRSQSNLVTSETTLPDGSVIQGELTKKQMEELSHRWSFTGNGAEGEDSTGKGPQSAWKPEGLNVEKKKDFIDAAKLWEFEPDKPKGQGKGDRSRQNAVYDNDGNIISGIGASEASEEAMAAASHKWEFVKGNKYAVKGNEVQSAFKPEGLNEESETDFIVNGKRWDFDKNGSKNGKGDKSRQNADKESGTGMGVAELDQSKMAAAAKKWEFTDKYSKAGGGVASRVPPEIPEADAGTMEGKSQHGNYQKHAGGGKKAEKRKWEIGDTATKAGKGDASRVAPPVPEIDKKTMGNMAIHGAKNTDAGEVGTDPIPRKWEFDPSASKAGQGDSSRVPPAVPESNKTTMEKSAVHGAKNTDAGVVGTDPVPRKWEFDPSASKAGKGEASRAASPVPEESKANMEKKAAKHVKQTITDFLMG